MRIKFIKLTESSTGELLFFRLDKITSVQPTDYSGTKVYIEGAPYPILVKEKAANIMKFIEDLYEIEEMVND